MDDSKMNRIKALLQQAMDLCEGAAGEDDGDGGDMADAGEGDAMPSKMMAMKLAKYK